MLACVVAGGTSVVAPAFASTPVPSTSSVFVITTVTLPAGVRGVGYRAPLGATGGDPPYRWSVAGGTLPPGLHVKSWMGFHPTKTTGWIWGTPRRVGAWTFTVRVIDAKKRIARHGPPVQHTATAVLSITVS